MLDVIQNIDSSILLWIQDNIRNDYLTPIMKAITHLGDYGLFWFSLAIILLIVKPTRKTGLLSVISFVITAFVVNGFLKTAVARVRPYEVVEGLQRIIEAQVDWSFPSGHTSSSFAVAVVIYKTCPKKFGIPALVLATLIALSRLYVGVHYPTDVIVGMLISSAIALGLCKISEILQTKHKAKVNK